MGPGDFIEVVLPEAPLRTAMIRYGLNVLGPVDHHLDDQRGARLFRPQRPAGAADDAHHPQHAALQPEPGGCQPHHRAVARASDEIGTAERELAHMQMELTQTLQQKSRLAALGLAVSKISHDLRNMLANAQLISDRLGEPARPGRAALRAEADRLARPRHQPRREHAQVRARRGGAAAPRADRVCARWSRRSATAWACRARVPSPGPSTSTRRCASTPIATSCSAC